MRRRLYFVLPDRGSAETIERELLLAKIDDHHMHFMARDGINLGRLTPATLFQCTDLIHGLELGLVAGGLTGAIAGGVMFMYPGLGQGMGLGLVLLLALVGAGIGAWASAMIAVSVPNTRLKEFESALEQGKILLMVDIPVHRVREVRQMIMSHHPEAEGGGQDTQIPAFP